MTVRAALLQLLDEGARHGYQLKVDFESRTGGIWPLNVGQVYSTLERLVRDGQVEEVAGDGEHRTYRITEGGRREVKEWLASSVSDAQPPRDELIMKVLLAVGAGGREARRVIDDQRAALLAALQRGRRQQRRRGEGADSMAERMAHDALLTRLEAEVTWLDRCEEVLRSDQSVGRTR